MWKGKRILLGITGGIAAYKIPLLVRELIKLEAEVKCVLTPASLSFVSPLVLSTLSKNDVIYELYDGKTGKWTNHVELALWADIFIIAPLTATTLSKMAIGHSDNLLMCTYLSAKCPVFVAPAMDLDMYAHPSTQENLKILQKRDVKVIPATSGELASGLEGQGRMEEPEKIVQFIEKQLFISEKSFETKKVLVTAGPTHEAIDPVRFIGNHSSGKMGIALAEAFAAEGADVFLVLGPTNLRPQNPRIEVKHVNAAAEMFAVVQEKWATMDFGIFAAAVADYKPQKKETQKIKKSAETLVLELQKNPDILSWAGRNKTQAQCLLGFALETNNAEENARQKLLKKNADFIVLNSLENEGAGFQHDTNHVSIVGKDNKFVNFGLLTKVETAKRLLKYIKESCNEK
jgi:phosphopantothenoylcysteine decarboxylase/phosphopantothenate--cysteine ligase